MSSDPRIKNVVVLMFENRSFDHMLGFLKEADPRIEGLTSANPLTNPEDCKVLGSPQVPVNKNATYESPVDPGHDVQDVNVQLFCDEDPQDTSKPANQGFIRDYTKKTGNLAKGRTIMDCFDPTRVPALATLAQEFAICDHWFCSVPGPTWPNRFFVNAATSDGVAAMGTKYYVRPYPMRTLYENLAQAGASWRIYFHDIPQSLALSNLRSVSMLRHFRRFRNFAADVGKGDLPHYTFIEPRYFPFLGKKANDQHPPHDVRLGEDLIADVYDTLRGSAFWPGTLLIVLYDEHGGYFDHVAPPVVRNPDGKISTDPLFDFRRGGPRVPAVLVSPWIPKGTLDTTVYDHASVPATLKDLFQLSDFLTMRDRTSNPLNLSLWSDQMRDDTPETLPRHMEIQAEAEAAKTLALTVESVAESMDEASEEPLSEYQQSLLDLASTLAPEPELQALEAAFPIETEHEGAVQVRTQVLTFFARQGLSPE
jgi:phospholipase C